MELHKYVHFFLQNVIMSYFLESQDKQQHESIYALRVSKNPEYVEMLNDIARFTIIQLAIQIMLVLMDPTRFSIFSMDFLILLIFVNIGVMLYWLVFRKIVVFHAG